MRAPVGRYVDTQERAHRHVPSDVVLWRRELLLEAAFGAELAERLAGDRRYDLHALLTLVDRGCPPHLAAQILAPL
jgi:hypothetical protein